jgi:hypothetical protein
MLAIDTSYAQVTPQIAADLKAAGVELAFQCLTPDGRTQPPYRVINLRNYLNAGILIAGYASLPTGAQTGVGCMAFGQQGVPPDLWTALVRNMVDVELPGISEIAIREAIDWNYNVGGKPRTVYTSESKWKALGNFQTFGDTELVDALWNNLLPSAPPIPNYGKWAYVLGSQYQGGHQEFGIDLDRDVIYISRAQLLAGITPVQAADLRDLRISILEGGMKALLDGNGQNLVDIGRMIGGK